MRCRAGEYDELLAASSLVVYSRRHSTQMRILGCGYCVASSVFWIVSRSRESVDQRPKVGAVVSRRELSGPKPSEGGLEAGGLSLGAARVGHCGSHGVCLPSGEAGKAETLIDPPHPPVSPEGQGVVLLVIGEAVSTALRSISAAEDALGILLRGPQRAVLFEWQCLSAMRQHFQRQATAAVRPCQVPSGATGAVLQRVVHYGMMPLCTDTALTSPAWS